MTTPIIELSHFAYTFRPNPTKVVRAARDISFTVAPGEVHGFLGPNGAGKSTSIKALLGLIRPADPSSVKLFGRPVAEGQWRGRVGYMPEQAAFYEFLTGFELVTWFGRLSGMSRRRAQSAADERLAQVGLSASKDRPIRTYSKGMLQRAGLAQALMGDPELLVLDEPMTGLDPIGRKEIRDLIVELRKQGKTIFFSTHILPDIEVVCDRVTIVHQGRTIQTEALHRVLAGDTHRVVVTLRTEDDALVERIEARALRLEREPAARLVHFDLEGEEEAARFVAELLASSDARLVRFEPLRAHLEDAFLAAVGSRPEEVSA